MPSWGLSQKLPRLIGANRAREVSFTALPLDAPTAAQWGIISRAVEPSQLLPEAKRLAGAIIKNQVRGEGGGCYFLRSVSKCNQVLGEEGEVQQA